MIEEFYRSFEGGRSWYLDGQLGDDNNDGRSWTTAKQHWSAIQNLIGDGDTIYIRNGLWDRIVVGYNQVVRIIGVGFPVIWGGDVNNPPLEVNGGRVFVVGLNLGGVGGNAERDCVLLEDLPRGQGLKSVKIYGGTWGIGGDIGSVARNNIEYFSDKIVERYVTRVVEVPAENQDWVRVQGNIATSPWLPAEGNAISFKGMFFPMFKIKTYTGITYDSGTDTSVITGLNPPFRAWEIPSVNDDVGLCLVKVNTDLLTYDHYKGEYIGVNAVVPAFKFENQWFGGFSVFQGCNLGWFNMNYTQGLDPALHLIFDGCSFTNFSPFREIIGADLTTQFMSFGFRDCIFYGGDGARLLKVVNANSPMKPLFKSGAFFHNVIVNVDFWNFESDVVKNWLNSFGLDYRKKIEADDIIELPFRENMWVQLDFLSLFIAIFMHIDTGKPIYQILTEKKMYPVGDITEWSKDTASLEHYGGTEVPLVYDVGEVLKGLMKAKRIEILK